MSETVAEVNTPLNDLKEALEREQETRAIRKETLERRMGKSAAEALLTKRGGRV